MSYTHHYDEYRNLNEQERRTAAGRGNAGSLALKTSTEIALERRRALQRGAET